MSFVHFKLKTATKTSKIKINMPNAVEKASIHNINKIQVLESVKTGFVYCNYVKQPIFRTVMTQQKPRTP